MGAAQAQCCGRGWSASVLVTLLGSQGCAARGAGGGGGRAGGSQQAGGAEDDDKSGLLVIVLVVLGAIVGCALVVCAGVLVYRRCEAYQASQSSRGASVAPYRIDPAAEGSMSREEFEVTRRLIHSQLRC